MADKQCAYVDHQTGVQCQRMLKSGLFCPIHSPTNRGTVCYVQLDERRLEEEMQKAEERKPEMMRRRRKPPPVA